MFYKIETILPFKKTTAKNFSYMPESGCSPMLSKQLFAANEFLLAGRHRVGASR